MDEKKEETPASTPSSSGKNTGMAVICYLGILVLIPFLSDAKNDSFVKFHIKQGLVLLIAAVISGIVYGVPVIGWMVGPLAGLAVFILMIMGIMNAAGGKEVKLPLIGDFGDKFNI